jgi:hypothetical protein
MIPGYRLGSAAELVVVGEIFVAKRDPKNPERFTHFLWHGQWWRHISGT